MPNNLVVQLLLKTGAFSDDLKTARGQIQNFQKGCSTAGQAVSGFSQALGINIGGIAKFGGVVGIAVAAGKEFKNILESSQTTADSLAGAIAGCKGAVDSLRTAIASGDFTLLSDGLWSAYKASKALQDTLDQLENTQIAYDYKSAKNQTKFQEGYTMYKDPESTPQMKEEAKKKMQEAVDAQLTYASNYSNALYKTYVAQVVQKAGTFNMPANNVTPSQFEKAMDIDLGLLGDPGKMRDYYKKRYDEYLSKIAEYETSLWEQLNGGDKYNNIAAVEDIKKKYKDDIAINAMLQLMKDGGLKGIGQMLTAVEQAQKLALSMEQTMNRAIKGEFSTGSSKGSTGGKSSTTTITTPIIDEVEKVQVEEKLAELYKEFDSIKNNLGVPETNTILQKMNDWEGSWEEYVNSLTDEEKILFNKFEEVMKKRFDLLQEISLYETTKSILDGRKTAKTTTTTSTNNEDPDPLPGSYAYRKKELNDNIDKVRKSLTESVNLSDEDIKKKLAELTVLEQKLSALEEKFGFRTVTKQETNTWDEFNKAMANTSTIANALFNTFKEGSEITASSILQMISTTLPAIGSLISAIGALTSAEAVEAGVAATGKAVSTSKHWIEAIAAVASLGAVVATAISAASKPNLQRFAEGGIVGGSSFTGDRVPAMVNSGEMILNKTQQARLFKIANGGAPGDNAVTFHISGTDLVGVLNNNSRKNKLIR